MKAMGKAWTKKLALAIVLIMTVISAIGGTAFAGEVCKDQKIGDYTWTIYDGGGNGSLWISQYSGSATEIKLPTSVTYGGKTYTAPPFAVDLMATTFAGNTQLTKIAIPNGYGAIMSGSFKGCTSLTEVAIGDSVNYLDASGGQGAFYGCPAKTYYFKGENVSVSDVKGSGIGTDASGNPITGVTVWTKAGSPVDLAIKELNNTTRTSAPITLRYDDDPYSKNTVDPNSGGNTETNGVDGTPYGKGASESVMDRAITKYASEKDPKGSVFNILQAKINKVKKTSMAVKWRKASGAKKYIVYGNKCGKKNKMVRQTVTTKNAVTFKKVNGKKLKKGTYYKFIVVAIDGNGKVISTSKMVHAATKGGKVGNDKAVKVKKSKVKIKKGKKAKLGAKAVPQSKKLKVKRHRGIAYESSNPAVASVNKKGVVKGLKKGSCYVYAYAQCGVFKKVKITVK